MDTLLVVAAALLALTLTAFFLGAIPYPYGWIVLVFVLIVRLNQLKRKNGGGR